MERLEFDLLFRWFVGIGVDDAVWDHSTFSKNRDRLLEGDVAAKFMTAVLDQPRVKRLLSTDHFSVDGTLVEAWASMKSFKPRDGSGEPPASGGARNREADFHGPKPSNETHVSTTDPEARLYRKGPGKEAKLCFMRRALMENPNGLVVDVCLSEADGHAERIAALHMIEPRADRPKAVTLGADKAYDAQDFVNELRSMNASLTWRRIRMAARRRSTAARRGTQATPSANASGSGSRRPSTGSRRSRARSEPGSAVGSASDGPPPTIWRDCRSSSRPQHESPGALPTDRSLADRRVRPLGSRSPRSLWPGDADDHRGGEIAFGALETGLEVEYARNSVGFRWAGCEEGEQVDELLDDGSIEIEFACDTGDEAVLKAKRMTSSTAC